MVMTSGVPLFVASKLLGKNVNFLRWGLQKNRFPFGCAVQTSVDPERWSYHVSPQGLAKYLGITVAEITELAEAFKEDKRQARTTKKGALNGLEN